MATHSSDQEKWQWVHSGSLLEEEEVEEALSLCDLPVNLMKPNNQSSTKEGAREGAETSEDDFNFDPRIGGSVCSVVPNKPEEMCAADDIFFQGQILPHRLSISSESSLITKFRNNSLNSSTQSRLSRSDSMDHGGFTSFSSRSNSSRSSSHYSSSSNNSSAANSTRIPNKNPRFHNNIFLTHPSPKPHIRLPGAASLGNAAPNRNKKSSSVWDVFRLGLVRAPEIELQDLKARSSVSQNSSSSSSRKSRKRRSVENRSGGVVLSSCSCSVRAVKPVALKTVAVKSRNNNGGGNGNKDMGGGDQHEKLLKEVKKKKKKKRKKQMGERSKKEERSGHRTFKWIKELSSSSSHAS